MAILEQQKLAAQETQHKAAHDARAQVRLVAGPGTGKSFAIEERVRWLLSNGISPAEIFVVSFTRASSRDLKTRIRNYCSEADQLGAEHVNVSTLHSLALKALMMKRVLQSSPVVLDPWETENIFDEEFAVYSGYGLGRCREIRDIYEASLATDISELPEHRLPAPQTEEEREQFLRFHQSRREVYRCVLPGEIIRECLNQIEIGELEPASLLKIEHLIIDEFQDLNDTDLQFVYHLIAAGVNVFVAGDDDQSIYSFRYASPSGIQNFHDAYPNSGTHELKDCFRCTPNILIPAKKLVALYGSTRRIPKNLRSLYEESSPPEKGVLHTWKMPDGKSEAKAIAQSCKSLIEQGISPREILILLGNQKVLFSILKEMFKEEQVEFEPPRESGFTNSKVGRFVFGLIRIVCNPDDYIGHRLLLALPNVGAGTCNNIVEGVLEKQLNYKEIFRSFWAPPRSAFDANSWRALDIARDVCVQIKEWEKTDTIGQRAENIAQIVSSRHAPDDGNTWKQQVENLPQEMTLEELDNYLVADTDEQQEKLLSVVYERLGLEIPEGGFLPKRVRIMTMHGAKGLSAQVVFIPGLENGVLPRQHQLPYPGAVQEAARMLYVSVTRAKAACIMSYAAKRIVHGERKDQDRSELIKRLGIKFDYRQTGMTEAETNRIKEAISNL